jgi:hypothetical protein
MSVALAAKESPACCRTLGGRHLGLAGGAGLLEERRDLVLHLLRDGDRGKVPLSNADEDVFAGRDRAGRIDLAPNLEVQMNRGPANSAEIGLHHEELVELDRHVEIALDPHTREPEAVGFRQNAVGEPGRAQQLGFRERKEAQVRLVVDDARGVYVLPADVLFDAVTGQEPSRRPVRSSVVYALTGICSEG